MTEASRDRRAEPSPRPPMPGTTPSQTIGPFFALPGGVAWPDGGDAVPAGTPRELALHGRLLDGNGDPVPDGLIEIWQADADGGFGHPDDPRGEWGSQVFGRSATDREGAFAFRTVKPAPLPAPDGGTEAPHINVTVLARGMLQRVVTRVYFPDEQAANEADPVLSTVDPARRATLVAGDAEGGLRFDIRLQGDDETVFFDV
jgi:protocatechuate 3,4-dioxygenase alpha subunit